jgi:hypothetical protein
MSSAGYSNPHHHVLCRPPTFVPMFLTYLSSCLFSSLGSLGATMAIAALPTALVQHIQLLNRFYVLISSLQVFRTPVPRAGTAQYQHNSTIPTQQHHRHNNITVEFMLFSCHAQVSRIVLACCIPRTHLSPLSSRSCLVKHFPFTFAFIWELSHALG